MMRMLGNKKNVKIMSVFIAAIFILGIAGLAYMQMNTPTMAAPSSNIGVVDTNKVVMADSTVVQNAQKTMESYNQELKQQFDQQSANMDDQQKQQLYMQYSQKMQAKQAELQQSIGNQVQESTKSVAEAKGLSIVLNKDYVLYGGMDITDQVSKKFSELAKSAAPTGAATDTSATTDKK